MVVIVVLAKVPVNCSREGVILQMALGVINATKEPAAICGFTRDGFSCYQRNQGAGCILRLLFTLWACLAASYWDAQQVLPPDCSRKLGGTVILYNELKLFVSLNCFNVDNLLLNFSQSRLAVSL